MSVSIITCPSCTSLLLSDTVQCPTCLHVLDAERARAFPIQRPQDQDAGSEAEDACPICGEMVRRGLVRCWSCGSFMHQEIAETYQKMQEGPSDVIYSVHPKPQQPGAGKKPATGQSPPAARLSDDDDDFELAPQFHLRPGTPAAAADPSQTYGLVQPPEPAAPERPPANEASAPAADETSGAPVKSPEAATLEGSEIDHSVATGGDVLLQVALDEEIEEERRRKGLGRRGSSATREGFLIYCPNGHRIEVREKHRGQRGRCPKCKTPFLVPPEPPPAPEPAPETPGATEPPPAESLGKFSRWLLDVHLHIVDPQKLRLKPGSLKSDFQEIDLGLGPDGILAVSLVKKGGLFATVDKKKKDAAREAVREHLRNNAPDGEVPAARHWSFAAEAVNSMAVVQPAAYAHESMFGGVPVFGEGWIAVRLPPVPDSKELNFCSFQLSAFRELAGALAELYGIGGLGEDMGVPLIDSLVELKCHYSDETLRALEHVEWYQADPAFNLKLVGRRCAECGLVVSEDSRKKEKIGGANGKAIAKAKCPKCAKKFGSISLYALEEAVPPPAEPAAEPESAATT